MSRPDPIIWKGLQAELKFPQQKRNSASQPFAPTWDLPGCWPTLWISDLSCHTPQTHKSIPWNKSVCVCACMSLYVCSLCICVFVYVCVCTHLLLTLFLWWNPDLQKPPNFNYQKTTIKITNKMITNFNINVEFGIKCHKSRKNKYSWPLNNAEIRSTGGPTQHTVINLCTIFDSPRV